MTTGLREQLQEMIGAAYSIERELGGGGMSRVFVAEERTLGRSVVVKVLPSELSSAVSAERFRREVQLVARLQHPGLVPLLSSGSSGDGDLLYYTMPFVEGESLRARLAREGELPIPDAVRILREIADALAYAHAHDVVHRDIKPDNVLLTGSHALVTDFGIAKALGAAAAEGSLTGTGLSLGTPAYMSPEAVAADLHVDHRADIYALGALAYEILTGSPPFVRATTQATLSAHVTQRPEAIESHRPSVSPALAALVMRCLEKHPADRPQSAAEVMRELESPAMFASSQAGEPPKRGNSRAQRYAGAGIVVLVVAVGGYALSDARIREPDHAGLIAVSSIAVLPFANLSADSVDAYFSDGMTEEIITALGRVPDLHVTNRASSFAFRGTAVDVRHVAKQLGVGNVLTGSVRRADDQLRVSAQLVDGESGRSVWSSSYQRRAGDVFAIQEEIAQAIVAALKLTLGDNSSAPLTRHGTDDAEAYDLYLLGRHIHNQITRDGFERAIEYLTRATREDTAYAQAYALLAHVYSDMGSWYFMPPSEARARAKTLTLKAIELDSTLGSAHRELATLHAEEYAWSASEREFRLAIASDQNDVDALTSFAILLAGLRRPEEALAVAQRAQQLDPIAASPTWQKGRVLYAARRYDDSIREYARALELEPRNPVAHFMLAQSYLAKGLLGEALAHTDSARGYGSGAPALWRAACVLSRMGREREARALLQELERLYQTRAAAPGDIALVYVSLGEKDQAFAWLDRAYEEHDWWIRWLGVEPMFDPIRADPRFALHLDRAGLRQ